MLCQVILSLYLVFVTGIAHLWVASPRRGKPIDIIFNAGIDIKSVEFISGSLTNWSTRAIFPDSTTVDVVSEHAPNETADASYEELNRFG